MQDMSAGMDVGAVNEPVHAHTDAMRYLCVGAEVDAQFARGVIDELLIDQHRAVAPSYGMDVRPIVKHCLRAQRRRAIRDLALTLLLLGELILAPLLAVIAVAAVSWARETLRRPPRGHWRTVAWIVTLAAVALAAWLRLGHTAPVALRQVLGLSHIGPFLLSLPVTAVAAAAILYVEWHVSRRVVRRELDASAFAPAAPVLRLARWVRTRLDEIEQEQGACVTVCNMAEDSPFVGAGVDLRRLTVTVDVSRADRTAAADGRGPRPFVPLDLHLRLRTRMCALRDEAAGQALRLPRLDISDRVLIDGRTLRGSRPTREQMLSRARPEAIADIANTSAGASRHHLCLRIEPVDGEHVITVFVHVATHGQTLYVEFTPCVQPAINRTYRMVDARPFPTMRQRLYALGSACAGGVPMLLGAPGRLAGWQLRVAVRRRRQRVRRQADLQSWMDYGARTSVRDLGSAAALDHFQWLDVRMYVQVVLRQALNAVADFLTERGIDTSSLRSQEAMINQLIISGSYNFVGNRDSNVTWAPPNGRPQPGPQPHQPGPPPPDDVSPPGGMPGPGGGPPPAGPPSTP
jgi:hypothetical protein